ncbi:MAG TPA: isocitrate lyase/phosphoenolpyruvate mutase family protein [Gemmatimonadaceae bacterium]
MPTPPDLRARAERFRELHHQSAPLVLANVWDVASARIVEEAGYEALATTSAGVAWMLGYPDGQRISRDEMLGVVARITSAVRVPVTADLEAGYGPGPEDVAATVRGAIEAGAVGMNLEDSTEDPSTLFDIAAQTKRIAAGRAAADAAGIPFVINARTDVVLHQIGEPESRLREVLRRLAAYRDAGADCLFAPGVRDVETIATLVKELKAPINILAIPGIPTVAELASLGVARLSLGGGLMRAALECTRRLVRELRASGDTTPIASTPLTHMDMQQLFAR